jgi:hypothetical protein
MLCITSFLLRFAPRFRITPKKLPKKLHKENPTMKIFVCTTCENNVCSCTRREGGKPFICPNGHKVANWHEVKKDVQPKENEK